eukprot:CAMPEP_0174874956 /NCGR_PEP_ID=MMETSP1114-20130205/77564_1 /TAXON_ID=312471 /ORGANISM="Neobodo designis, Strain CCAP 1951/1" /LENGTH=416 /DNA_ID=CAMNT_0016110303 /DNA_START=37 /DNA_END=1287 /DNA_ORIENTATION=-
MTEARRWRFGPTHALILALAVATMLPALGSAQNTTAPPAPTTTVAAGPPPPSTTAAAGTSSPASTTAAPAGPATTAPPSPVSAAVLASTELDVRMTAFSDELVTAYLALCSEITGVPIGRFKPRYYGAVAAVEFGEEYIFTVLVGPPSNRTGDTDIATSVSERLESVGNAWIANDDARVRQRTFVRIARVAPEVRVSEKGRLAVNYVWVAFLLLAVVMVGVSIIVFIRRRASGDDGLVVAAIDEEKPRAVPRDEGDANQDALLRMVEKAEVRRRQREAKEREEAAYAPSAKLFISSLDTDHRLRLPPPCSVPDPLSREFGSSAQAAKSVSLGAATRRALNDLHEEVEEDLRGGAKGDGDGEGDDGGERRKSRADIERAAAEQAARAEAHKKRLETMRQERDRNRLMDLNDADMRDL